jgi:hypothetical protein
MFVEHCRHLAWLDSEPANFYLIIEAAEKLNITIGPYRTRSPVRYMRAPGIGENGSGTKLLGGQLRTV